MSTLKNEVEKISQPQPICNFL